MRAGMKIKENVLTCFIIVFAICLLGCSASEPPVNPYSCPTAPGYTLPNYCKPGQEPLATTSIGEGWVVPFALYLYTEAPTTVEDDASARASTAAPKIYVLKPSNVTDGDFCSTPGVATPVPCANDGSTPSAQLISFDTTGKFILAQHDQGATTPPEIIFGIFAYDPDGKLGSGLDVSISFLATDKDNVNAGIFQSSTSLFPLVQGAGKKTTWRASSPTNPTQLLADDDYTVTATGFDDKNFSFATQIKVKVCTKGATGCE